MYTEHKAAVDDFVEETKWGFISHECVGYLNKRFGVELHWRSELANESTPTLNAVFIYIVKNYSQSRMWLELATALLQPERGMNHFLEKGAGGYGHRKLKSIHIKNNTQVCAKGKVFAYARLFIEIEEDFERLVKSKAITPHCGYAVLKVLYNSERHLCALEIIKELKYAQTSINNLARRERFQDTILAPLKDTNFIVEKNNTYFLHQDTKEAFAYANKIRKDVLNWKYRTNWLLPWH